MKKVLLIILLIALWLTTTLYAIDYVGFKKLCCIDSNNTKTCLSSNQSIDLNSDLYCSLYEEDYTIEIAQAPSMLERVIQVFSVIVIVYIIFLIAKRK